MIGNQNLDAKYEYLFFRPQVITDPDPEVKAHDEKVREFFQRIAGDDLEVDWMELKEILDFALKKGKFLQFTYGSHIFYCFLQAIDKLN